MILRLGDRWLADIEIYSMGSLRVSGLPDGVEAVDRHPVRFE